MGLHRAAIAVSEMGRWGGWGGCGSGERGCILCLALLEARGYAGIASSGVWLAAFRVLDAEWGANVEVVECWFIIRHCGSVLLHKCAIEEN